MTDRVIKKLYLITKDLTGHSHHYVSSKAMMHYDVVLEFNVDLEKEIILEKGFILGEHRIFANDDIRKNKNDDAE